MGKNKKIGKQFNDLYNESYKLNDNIQAMYKEASKPEDVKVFIEEAEYLESADAIVQYCKDKPEMIKEKSRVCPYDPNINIKDIQLNTRGPQEDQAYGLDPFLVKNIRRGNTVLQVDGKNVMGRKGLNKFFDMRIEFIEEATRLDISQLKMEQRNHKNYQLAGPLKAILEGHSIEIVKTLKANGENAQVSWNPEA